MFQILLRSFGSRSRRGLGECSRRGFDPRSRRGRAGLVAALLLLSAPAQAGQVLVDMLDVGQGDAILIRGGGKTVLIDAGPKEGGVVDQLRALGVTRLDLVVGTHPHADHIGRMADVLEAFEVGLYMDNGLPHTTRTYEAVMTAVEARGVPYRSAKQGLALNLGSEASFKVLFPPETHITGTRSDLNSNSVVMWLDHGEVDFLFTGDSEEPTEHALAAAGLDPVDVLKVAHHGSGHSSTASFLSHLKPRYALISCGVDNRYDHPYPEALQRLAAVGAQIYRTDLSGNLRVVSDGVDVEVFEGTIAELDQVRIVPRFAARPVAAAQPAAPQPAADAPPSKKEQRRQLREQRRADRLERKALRRQQREDRRQVLGRS